MRKIYLQAQEAHKQHDSARPKHQQNQDCKLCLGLQIYLEQHEFCSYKMSFGCYPAASRDSRGKYCFGELCFYYYLLIFYYIIGTNGIFSDNIFQQNCPLGWVKDYPARLCYLVSRDIVPSYNDAREFCWLHQGTLAEIRDEEEFTFLNRYVSLIDVDRCPTYSMFHSYLD